MSVLKMSSKAVIYFNYLTLTNKYFIDNSKKLCFLSILKENYSNSCCLRGCFYINLYIFSDIYSNPGNIAPNFISSNKNKMCDAIQSNKNELN